MYVCVWGEEGGGRRKRNRRRKRRRRRGKGSTSVRGVVISLDYSYILSSLFDHEKDSLHEYTPK